MNKLLLLLLLTPASLSSGGACSAARVVPVGAGAYHYEIPAVVAPAAIRVETPTEKRIRRTAEICEAVNKFTLPQVLMLHVRVTDKDFSKFPLNEAEKVIFRAAIKMKYDENLIAIRAMEIESSESYRRAVMAPIAKEKNLRRRRRKSKSSPEATQSFVFEARKATLAAVEEGKDERRDESKSNAIPEVSTIAI